jgi:hypothetical protein
LTWPRKKKMRQRVNEPPEDKAPKTHPSLAGKKAELFIKKAKRPEVRKVCQRRLEFVRQ